jgi:hypothetical protein
LLSVLTFWSWRSTVGKIKKAISLRSQYENFKIVDHNFWERARQQSDIANIYLYHVKTDSSFPRLLDVVSNDYYVRNEELEAQFALNLNQVCKNNAILIKLLSKGGEGKSTFLYHIAKKFHDRFNTVLLEDIDNEVLIRIEERLMLDHSNRPLLLIEVDPIIRTG